MLFSGFWFKLKLTKVAEEIAWRLDTKYNNFFEVQFFLYVPLSDEASLFQRGRRQHPMINTNSPIGATRGHVDTGR